MVEAAIELFNISSECGNAKWSYFENGMFTEIDSNVKLVSMPAESCIVISKNGAERKVSIRQISFKRCTILIAFKEKNRRWRIRFRVVVTPNDGVLVSSINFPFGRFSDDTFEIPAEDRNSAILVLGINTQEPNFYMKFVVNAKKDGHNGDETSYEGFVGAELVSPFRGHVEDNLIPAKPSKLLKFDHRIYKPEPKPLSSFKHQPKSQPRDSG